MYKPLLMMRGKGLLGAFFGKHFGVPGLSKSAGNDLAPGAPLSPPVWDPLPQVILTVGQPMPYSLGEHCLGGAGNTYVRATSFLPSGITLNLDGTFSGTVAGGGSGFPTFTASNSHGNATSSSMQWSAS